MGERRQINGLGVRARLDINSGGRERGRRHIAAYHRDLESVFHTLFNQLDE